MPSCFAPLARYHGWATRRLYEHVVEQRDGASS
jgi:uncharacterized damage-inducible protein DinB